MIDAVRHVEGVLPDRPVEALYIEMGDWAMVFRVRWWIESYVDTRRVIDRVHTALQRALDEAGIDCPYPTQSLTVQVKEGTLGPPTRGSAFQGLQGGVCRAIRAERRIAYKRFVDR